MNKIVLYGAGSVAQYLLENYIHIWDVVGIVLTEKYVEEWNQIPAYSVSHLDRLVYDELWLASSDISMLHTAIKYGVSKSKLVICNRVMCDTYCKENKGILDVKYQKKIADEYEFAVGIKGKKFFTRTMNRSLFIPYFFEDENGYLCNYDYVRYATLSLLIEEIKRKNVGGELAELGVYKGTFSSVINSCFADRRLYLFDTFEGFDSRDVDIELQNDYTSSEYAFKEKFSDTSVDEVMEQMAYPEKVVLCKGNFPETIPQEDIDYALVSIDCDLYRPVLEGIRYFYTRLIKGGYILIHDYNNDGRWKGIKIALEEVENEFGPICKVPIPDNAGSIILTK